MPFNLMQYTESGRCLFVCLLVVIIGIIILHANKTRCSLKLDKTNNFLPEYVITYGMTDKLWHKKFSFRDNFYSLLCIQLISIVFFRSVQIVFTSQFCLHHIFSGNFSRFFMSESGNYKNIKKFFFIQINFFWSSSIWATAKYNMVIRIDLFMLIFFFGD